MQDISVELRFAKKSVLLCMERYGLTPQKVSGVATRIVEEPFIGNAASERGQNIFEFYWQESQWNEHYRVLYRRIDNVEITQVTLIGFERVNRVPTDAPFWKEPMRYIGGKLGDKVFDAALSALAGIL